MDSTQCMIEKLHEMGRNNIKIIEIYYCEDMKNATDNWSIDVMNNDINTFCQTAWTWTVTSLEEDKAYREEYDDDSPLAEYEIVINEPFSDNVVCAMIQTWLSDNGLGNYGFNVVMIDLKDAAPYSGYVKSLMNRDLDEEIKNAVLLEI